MINKNSRVKLLAAAVASVLLSGSAVAGGYESEMVILHPFQWHYNNIAKECTEYLGPAGFDGVQISQPAEHINYTAAWWAVYQPVTFKKFTTMTGNEAELRAMTKACNDAGVKVFADAVFNQRGSYCANGCQGLGGTGFNAGNFQYEDLSPDDFHRNGCTISNYGDANHVRTCALSGMPDLATDKDSTQQKIAEYLASLMDMGVYGFRVDAAKHMGYNDLKGIFAKVKSIKGRTPPAYYEVIGAGGEAADIQPDRYTGNENNVVTDFTVVSQFTNVFQNGNFDGAFGINTWLGYDNAEVFVNNHDNEALRCSAGTCSMNTQNNQRYHMAQSWLAVYPIAKVRQLYSGYQFSSHDPAGPISADRCTGGWLCQHREPMVLNAVRFARATRDQAVTSKGYDNGALWMNRGNKGFYVMNTTGGEFTREFSVEVPDGTYCDILAATDPCGGAQITVKNGKATFTVKGERAAAICVGEWCGKQVDPCEEDPNGAACLCKDDTNKTSCSAYCSTSEGAQTKECVCSAEEVNKDGLCISWCEANPNDEGCYCVLNPDAEECQIKYEQTKGELCYAGTSNEWTHEPMKFSPATGEWTITLELTGEGDATGAQRFKITDGCSWQGTVYGAGSGNVLVENNSASSDVVISQKGTYVLSVNDATMAYTLKEAVSNTAPNAQFTASVDGLSVTINNSSTDADGDKLTYTWDFGDGETSSTEAPTHTYAQAGTYTIKLTVRDANGATATASQEVTVEKAAESAVYEKVALRSTEDDFGTVLFDQTSTNVWTLTGYEFSKGTNKLKIEALNGSQCIIIGGELGKALTAAGDFIAVEDGVYDLTFNAKTNVLTIANAQQGCVGDMCGQACNQGADCVDGICQGQDCAYEEVVEPSDKTKNNCSTDGTTNNCETASLAYDFLGAIYSKDSTTFRIWSPDSSNVTVEVDGESHSMTKASINGYSDVYEVTVQGDLDLKPYQFKINGKSVRDPYGKMVVPASYSGSDGVGVASSDNRNIVMNMRATDLENGWSARPVLKNREDSIIYEVHVRDFTIDSSSGVSDENRGRYLGMVETGTTSPDGLATGIDHLKELGITHVQLLPVYDFGTCSDADSQDTSCYNWGYDPVNFNVPEDRYSSVFKTEEYRQKVKEFKQMVDEFHKNGIRVIMDVVYNHTYNKEMFQDISSKYYTSTDLSGCGNSVDAKNDMVSRFIRDSLEYWLTEYNIDGFRFDLVGIFDIDDFKDWGEYLNSKYPERNILMYGEPWNGYATDSSEGTRVRMGTIRQGVNGHVGIFNGKYRECVKGDSDGTVGGFMFNMTYHDLGAGVSDNVSCVSAGIKGGIGDNTSLWTPLFAADPEQAVQYISAHDNLTLADKISKMGVTGEYADRLQSYGNGLMLVSQGIPFIHAGAEFARTKNGNHNSYKSANGDNDIKWGAKKTYKHIFDYYKGMIAMRKAHPAFRMTTRSQIESNVKTSGQDGAIVVDINGGAVGDSWSSIKMVINSGSNMTISGVDGWYKKVNGVTVNNDGQTGNNTAEGTAVTIWYK